MTLLTSPLFSGPFPVPYSVTVGLDLDFDGIGAQFFEFGLPATATATGVASGVGGALVIPIQPFSLNFSYDAFSDQFLGFDVPSATGIVPTPTAVGTRAGFILGPVTVESVLLTQVGRIIASSGPLSTVLSSTLTGSIQVTYEFTRAVAVPEPALMALFVAGAASAGWRRLTRTR